MRFKTLILVLILIVIWSCKPQNELNYSEEKLIDVTKDLYIAAESIRRIDDKRADSLRILYNDQIEAIHNIDLALYEDDIASLKKDNKNYLAFHKIVRDTLNAINDSIKGEKNYKGSKKK